MPRRKPDDAVKSRMWAALLKAAKRHHQQDVDRGMVTRIAEDAGVSKASVSEWKRGRNYPEDATLRRLADLYGVSAEALSGYPPVLTDRELESRYGPPDEMLRRAADITELVVTELLPSGTTEQFVDVMRRAHELLAEGASDSEARGQLFLEVSQMKREANGS